MARAVLQCAASSAGALQHTGKEQRTAQCGAGSVVSLVCRVLWGDLDGPAAGHTPPLAPSTLALRYSTATQFRCRTER
jgi:hypothetical protein